jgi:hypothetical protein
MSFVQNPIPTFVKQPTNGKVKIVNADGQTQKTVYTAGANGSKITALVASSTDTSGVDVQVSITNGGTSYPIGTVNVYAGAGNSGTTNAVNLLNLNNMPGLPVDSDGQPYLLLISGDTLTLSALTTVTSAKQIAVSAIGGDF